jgi:hypothetical protein
MRVVSNLNITLVGFQLFLHRRHANHGQNPDLGSKEPPFGAISDNAYTLHVFIDNP